MMVIGDLIAKIGRDETYIGNHSLHYDSNENDQRHILHLVKIWLLAPYIFLIKTYTSTLGLPHMG
jgi:hypothetical protein